MDSLGRAATEPHGRYDRLVVVALASPSTSKVAQAWRGPRETWLRLRGGVQAIQTVHRIENRTLLNPPYPQMMVREGSTNVTSSVTMREFDDIEALSQAFCTVYNTHPRVCRQLVTALSEHRQAAEQREAAASKSR